MPTAPPVFLVCSDPGCARALAPVVQSLSTAGRLKVRASAHRLAQHQWSLRRLDFEATPSASEPVTAALYYYNYGLLNRRRLSWVGRANLEIFAAG